MAEVLSGADVDAALAERKLDWEREDDVLVKVVRRKDFREALTFVNQVGDLADAADHHPDIDIRWNTVTLGLSTHSAGGLTAKDLDLAGAIDGLSAPTS